MCCTRPFYISLFLKKCIKVKEEKQKREKRVRNYKNRKCSRIDQPRKKSKNLNWKIEIERDYNRNDLLSNIIKL